jgi:molecular chaperone GrpE
MREGRSPPIIGRMAEKPDTRAGGAADEPVKVVDRRWWARGEQPAADPDAPGLKPSYVEELEQRLAEREEQLRQYAQQVKAAAAEFDDARVRARREVTREIDRGKRAVLAELLDVVDNLDRAIEAGRSSASVETLLEGVRLVRAQFLSRLEGFGISPIDALHQPFDPTLHEAVTTVLAGDADEDKVLGVVRPGYKMGDDVLRPAMVAVGKKADQVTP